jgi:hypothetical protein
MQKLVLTRFDKHRKISFSLSLFTLLLFYGIEVKSQNTEVIYHQWKMIAEAPTHYEISVRAVKCDPNGPTQVHVELFNEGVVQTAKFDLTITNSTTGATLVTRIERSLNLGTFILPVCGNTNDADLRVNLPVAWNPESLTYSVSFIQ